jgi:hypothetical protein
MKPGLRVVLILAVLCVGAVIGGAAVQYWMSKKAMAQMQAAKPSVDLAEQVERLNSLVPSQSHTMADVGYHWAALWFAAQKKNWPLARFFFDEARQHVRWTVAIRPVRKTPDGSDINIKSLFTAIDISSFAAVQLAIEDKNTAEFETAYKQALEGCYMCHKAAGKPYLRPMIPSAPPQTIINYDPNAKWPE